MLEHGYHNLGCSIGILCCDCLVKDVMVADQFIGYLTIRKGQIKCASQVSVYLFERVQDQGVHQVAGCAGDELVDVEIVLHQGRDVAGCKAFSLFKKGMKFNQVCFAAVEGSQAGGFRLNVQACLDQAGEQLWLVNTVFMLHKSHQQRHRTIALEVANENTVAWLNTYQTFSIQRDDSLMQDWSTDPQAYRQIPLGGQALARGKLTGEDQPFEFTNTSILQTDGLNGINCFNRGLLCFW